MRVIHQPVRSILFAALLLAAASMFVELLTGQSPVLTACAQAVVVANSATFANDKTVAPNSIAAAFGVFKTQNGQPASATSRPLPTALNGIKVNVNGVDAGLFFVSNGQINFLVPGSAPLGTVNITVTNFDNTTTTGTFIVAQTAPGIYTARGSGQGTAAALTTFDGASFQLTANPDGSEKDIDPGTKDRPNFLILYATGVRGATAGTVSVTIQGVPSRVDFAGAQGGFDGLDQLNVRIPPELGGLGIVNVTIIIGGKQSNVATVKIGGVFPPIRTQDITPGQTITGSLTADDQVQADDQGNTFFFDAYRFHATANTSVALDLRSSQFDAGVLIYKVESNLTLTFLGYDDQTGGRANRNFVNNNALLITVLPVEADYVIFASSSDVQPDGVGDYTLTFTTNVAQQINYGANINGTIATTDIQTSGGTYLDAFWFNGAQGDRVRVTMTSSAFRPFLIINKRNGVEITTDSDPEADVTKTLPETGAYIILATPNEVNRTGSYNLTLTKFTAAPGEAEAGAAAQPELPARGLTTVGSGRNPNVEHGATRRVIVREQ